MINIAVNDCIMHKNHSVMSGTKIFEGMISPIDAEVIQRLEVNGYEISSHVTSKDFGLSIPLGEDNYISEVVAMILDESVSACLHNDLFFSYQKEAFQNSLIYLHPTYGTVSRYGLVQLAPSMDQIGILCKDIKRAIDILSIISGRDIKDGAMYMDEHYSYTSTSNNIRIAYDRCSVDSLEDEYQRYFNHISKKHNAKEITLDYLNSYKDVSLILCCAEISHCINRYDGIRYGYRTENASNLDEIYTKSRTEALSIDAKFLSILGAMILTQDNYTKYYEKAMKVRRLIKNSISFQDYDVILLPTVVSSDPYTDSSCYALGSIAGFPTLTFAKDGYGFQLVSKPMDESSLVTAYEMIVG